MVSSGATDATSPRPPPTVLQHGAVCAQWILPVSGRRQTSFLPPIDSSGREGGQSVTSFSSPTLESLSGLFPLSPTFLSRGSNRGYTISPKAPLRRIATIMVTTRKGPPAKDYQRSVRCSSPFLSSGGPISWLGEGGSDSAFRCL